MEENKFSLDLVKLKNKVYNEKVIVYLLSMTLFVDAITGIMINIIGIERSPIGMIFRGGLILYFLFYYLLNNKINKYIFIAIALYFVINILLSYYYKHNIINGLMFDVIESTKILLMPILTLGLIAMNKSSIISYGQLKKVIDISINLLIGIYILGIIFGLGKTTYAGAGYKSVFNANNSFNIVVIVLFIFQIERTFREVNKINISKSVILIGILIFLGSKTSLMFIPFYFILKIIIEFKNINKKNLYIGALVTLVGGVITFIIFNKAIMDIINHQLYFLNKESESLITFFLSGRDKFLEVAFESFLNNISILAILFGVGSYYNQMSISLALRMKTIKNIEMDFFDILFSYGVIGIIITYGISIYIVIKNFRKIRRNKLTAEFIAFTFMMLFSILAGHVFPDAMSATYLAIIVAMINLNGVNNNEDSNLTFRRFK